MTAAFKGKLDVLTWKDVRENVSKVNKEFADIIDELDPSDEHFLVKATYPYGGYMMRRGTLMLPNADGDIVPITDASIDKKVQEAIGYNINSNPVCVVLKNSFEIFLPLEDRTISLYSLFYPGAVFGAWRMLSPEESHQPIFLWDMTAGARSVFMLPKITETKKHFRLKKAFNLSVDKPRTLMDHWEVFREIANHADFGQDWNAEVLFFSKKWFDHQNDKRWFDFYYYFNRSSWRGREFWRNQPIWNLIFSMVLREYQARPNPYIADTVKHLLHVGAGTLPAFAPAEDDSAAPMAQLQKVYEQEYEIRNYPPIIMSPDVFDFNNPSGRPVYYSLQFPTAIEFGPSTRARTSLVTDLHEVRSLLIRYESELSSDKFNIAGTPLHDLFGKVKYDYFHNNVELHSGMRNSAEMASEDENLLKTVDGKKYNAFPDMCSFVKGCIRVSHSKE